MAFSAVTARCPSLLRLPNGHTPSISVNQNSVSFRFSKLNLSRRYSVSVRSSSTSAVAPATEDLKPAILLTEKALKHLSKMRSERSEDLCLRIGVKQGGCSGMSYTMEFENRANARPDDSVIEYDGFVIGM
ncbi:Iron-sulfur assembly protein IscA [Citrus sinensis]|uniref:Iron-sulfur assembly protein IscA n=1 Tax=Citrus sinensis TaxID=2711 RepID=A0ACB8JK09_CITSI|nr:Iron-sulfur assembly protein IscA [Citrus sinensis]